MQRRLKTAWLSTCLCAVLACRIVSAQDSPTPPSEERPTQPESPPADGQPPAAAPPVVAPAAPPPPDAPLQTPVELAPTLEIEPEVATAPGSAPNVEEMVVTGSRIKRKDLAGPAPVIVFTREQILASGRANVGEFLQSMPEQSNAINRGTNNAGDGAIRISLRGIGDQATLVLLNGRRLPPGGTGADKSADLSSIPSNMVERIEVLKDGASAIYGSDAIAGVVNIITRRRFNGAEANVYGSSSTYGDGQQLDVNATVGTSTEKGGVLFSASYYNGAPAWAGNRDYSSVQRGLQFDPMHPGVSAPYDLGSGTVPGTRVVLSQSEVGVRNGNAFYNDLIRRYPTAGGLTIDPMSGQWRNFAGANLPNYVNGKNLGQDGFNFQPYNYLVTPQERFTMFSSGDYQLDKNVRAFFTSYYTKRNSAQTLAPEPLVLDDEGVTVSGQNLYNPFGRDFDAVRRRMLEFNRRTFRQDVNTFFLSAGIDGDLPESAGPFAGWFWEAVFNYNRNESTEQKTGNLRVTRLRDAVGPSFVDAMGMPRCGTAGSPIDGCVPLNLFGGPGSITRDQVNALTYTGVQRGYNELIGAQANISGELFHLAAKRGVGLAAGYEFRALSGAQIPDPVTVAGETTGNKLEITQGKYSVHEVYGELSVPIVENAPFLHSLELIGAGRGSFYSNFGSTFNYKLGARWSPLEDIAFRGTYSTAFRAPSVAELYQGAADNFANVSDPCGKNVAPGSALERSCGAAANNGDDRAQIRSRIGGSASLKPEKADIFTLGFVVRPRFAKNLSLTVDYFNTLITDTINGIGENVILQGCYPSADGTAPRYCSAITRDPATQRITNINNMNTNVGRDHLDGIDFAGQYDLNTPAGTFLFMATVAYLRSYDRTLADGTVINGAGTWDLNTGGYTGVGGAYPHVRFTAGVTWAYENFSASMRTFFIGSYKECGDSSGKLQGDGLCYAHDHFGERDVSAYNTWDLVFGYSFKSSAGRTTLSVGATNLFDVAPPRVYNGFANTTDTYTYDMLMRQVYARIGHQF